MYRNIILGIDNIPLYTNYKNILIIYLNNRI